MRVTPNTYALGAEPRLRVTFLDVDGFEADPTAVTFEIIEPDGDMAAYVYGVDVELVKEAVGKYYVDFLTLIAGTHCYRFQGTGDVRAVAERQFIVDAGCFPL